jgi:hypothetical protein
LNPHDLLILKLEAYGLSKSALDLMHSYLSERKQCVKVGVDFSAWKNIYKGVPQGQYLALYYFLNFPFPKYPQPYSILCLSMTMYCHQHSYIKYFLLQN